MKERAIGQVAQTLYTSILPAVRDAAANIPKNCTAMNATQKAVHTVTNGLPSLPPHAGAVIALGGLAAVALLVTRRH